MSNSIEKLEFILEKIDDLLLFKSRFKTTEDLLNDKMGYDATLMALLQIGETLNKLKDSSFSDKLPIKGSYDVRNFIAHDYEGVNKAIIEDIIRRFIPDLKSTIIDLVDKYE